MSGGGSGGWGAGRRRRRSSKWGVGVEWGNRWSATLRGTSAATGGEGVGGGGADKWVWEGLLSPKVPAGMTRRVRVRVGVAVCVCVCLHACARMCESKEPRSDPGEVRGPTAAAPDTPGPLSGLLLGGPMEGRPGR